MAQTYFAILTAAGEAKLANAIALGTVLNFTALAVGDGGGNTPVPDQLKTELVNEVRRAPLNSLIVDPANASQIVAEQVIPADVGGWWIREMGLYDDAGVLCAYANCPPTYKPLLAEGSGRTQVVRMVLIVVSTAAIQLKIDPAVVLATRSYVDTSILTALDGRIASQVEVNAGTNDQKFVTPKKLSAWSVRAAPLVDTGIVNAYTAANAVPLTVATLVHGVRQRVTIANTNNGASTYAPDELPAKPIVGPDLLALLPGALIATQIADFEYVVSPTLNGGNGAWLLHGCGGGNVQVSALTSRGKVMGRNGANLLPNGSGIFGNASWATSNFVAVVDANGGITYFANAAAVAGSVEDISSPVSMSANVSIALSAELYTLGMTAGSAQIRVEAFDSTGASLGTVAAISPLQYGSVWTLKSATGTTPANTASVKVHRYTNAATAPIGGVAFRRIKLEIGTAPSLHSDDADLAALGVAVRSLVAPVNAAGGGVFTPNTSLSVTVSLTAPRAGYIVAIGSLNNSQQITSGAVSTALTVNGTIVSQDATMAAQSHHGVLAVAKGTACTIQFAATANASFGPNIAIGLHVTAIFVPYP